jgi:hypothetical protein
MLLIKKNFFMQTEEQLKEIVRKKYSEIALQDK